TYFPAKKRIVKTPAAIITMETRRPFLLRCGMGRTDIFPWSSDLFLGPSSSTADFLGSSSSTANASEVSREPTFRISHFVETGGRGTRKTPEPVFATNAVHASSFLSRRASTSCWRIAYYTPGP